MIVRGNRGWANELPDKYQGLFDDEAKEETVDFQEPAQESVPEEPLTLLAQDSFHRELFARLTDSEIRTARKLCPFYRILRFFRKDRHDGSAG